MRILPPEEIKAWLSAHPQWSVANDELCAEFKFKDFVKAMSFIVAIGIHAEKHNHHPRIENVYNRVKVSLNTHDAGNVITDRDINLAEIIEKLNG